MLPEFSFTPEEEDEAASILLEALRITGFSAQENYIRERCQNNHKLIDRLLNDLTESHRGERISKPIILKAGKQIGNYEILEKIGEGGFSTIYRAKHRISGTLAAIKIFDKGMGETEIDIVWKKEGKSLSKLNHDNILKFYDLGFFEEGNRRLPYVVVELVKGKKLDEYCAREDSILDVLSLFRSVVEVVQYVHEKQILHLDLTPNNIIVTSVSHPTIKLIDFGSSKRFRDEPRRLTLNDYFFPLSLRYASPEQCERGETNYRSDIYSLGAILYQLLTGCVPFGEGSNDKAAIMRDVTDRDLSPTPPSVRILENSNEKKFGLAKDELSKVLAGDLDAIVMRCLQKRRRDRYKAAADLNRDLDRFLHGKPVTARDVFGYRQLRTLMWLFGFKGGRVSWAKWRVPLERLAVVIVLVPLMVFSINKAYQRFSEYAPIRKSLRAGTEPIPLRVLNEQGQTDRREQSDYYYVYCGDELVAHVCFTFLAVPSTNRAQPFQMGRQDKEVFVSPNENQSQENIQTEQDAARPIHPVNIKRFYMTRFEISNKQWNIVAKSKKIRIDLEVTNDDSSFPKTNVSYAEVREFCDRLSRDLSESSGGLRIVRLPSEAEWEYACRAGTYNRFGGSDSFVESFINAMPDQKDASQTALLKRIRFGPLADSYFDGNPLGFAAMNGNVWEMVSDSWHKSYSYSDDRGVQHIAPSDGSAWDQIDMKADNRDKEFVLRGGAFNRPPYMAQCSYRTDGRFIFSGNDQTGFRIALEAQGLR